MRRARSTRRRTGRLGPQRGVALILALLVLAILLVITVQFTYTVRVEQQVAANQGSSSALSLAARGAIWHLAAQLEADDAGEVVVGEFELAEADTLAEPYMDPEFTEARELDGAATGDTGGGAFDDEGADAEDARVSYEVEDLERRFSLAWLLAKNEGFKNHATAALTRLVVSLGHDQEFATQLVEFIQAQAEAFEEFQESSEEPAANDLGEEDEVPPRVLLSLNSLFEIEFEGVDQVLTGQDEDGEPVEGVKPLLDFLTVWDLPGMNVNTVLPEVFAAWLPNKDKKAPQPRSYTPALRVTAAKQLIVQRPHVEGDEEFEIPAEGEEVAEEEEAAEDDAAEDDAAEDDAGTLIDGEEPTGSDWIGKGPITNLPGLASLPSLRFAFSSNAGKGPGNSNQQGGGRGLTNWYDVLKFRSRLLRVTVTAESAGLGSKTVEAIIMRGREAEESVVETTVLEWREITP